MTRTSTLLFIALVPALLRAQEATPLPHGMTDQERAMVPGYREMRASGARDITTPPDHPVRTMAEWEEIQALTIAWSGYPTILKQIVRHAKEECEVIILCSNPTTVTNYLLGTAAGGPLEDLSGITLLQVATNSIWIRDYGAETMYRNAVDSLVLMDWIYNRPRPADDDSPQAVAAHLGVPLYNSNTAPYDLVHTGGNFMSDGMGMAFSSLLVQDENSAGGDFNYTARDLNGVNDMMEQWMGIDRYVTMPTLPYDAIHHIDMHMKLLDERTLLVGEFPSGVSDGPQLEANLSAVLANTTTSFGTPWKVVRIPMPPSTGGAFPPNASYRTFANNVFVNGTVLVPTYRTEYDTTALRILREELPGYRVIGIDCDNNSDNIIAASGAIHCITKGIGVDDPLLIQHLPLDDTYQDNGHYTVSARIRHRSGIAEATLYWTTDTTAGFTALPMVAQADDEWTAQMPASAVGSRVYYYIRGEAENGKVLNRPLVAPAGWWHFRVLGNGVGITPNTPVLLDLYPMPARDLVVLTLQDALPVEVWLRDATGRSVAMLYRGTVPQDGRLFLNISHLPAAPYVLEISNGQGRSARRLLKY